MMTGWAIVFYRQTTGYYLCQTVHIQLNDEFSPELATFSGLYDRCTGATRDCPAGEYTERGHGRGNLPVHLSRQFLSVALATILFR